jgi:Fic family protein
MSELRHSIADPVELITDPDEKARKEAANGIRQFILAMETVRRSILQPEKTFRLTQSLILELHEKALEGIHPLAGTYRNSAVTIGKSDHIPPKHTEVADHVADMCAYVNTHWGDRSPIHLAAYILWRLNWIHPFADGNGRTARIVSYLALSIRLNSVLPGDPTIPDQIAADKNPYYAKLEDADAAWKRGDLRIASMEEMLETMLGIQLKNATEAAGL